MLLCKFISQSNNITSILKEMYEIEDGNTKKLSHIFKNVKNGDGIIEKAQDQLREYKNNRRDENVRL